jgi:hypothetical protein
MEKSIDETFFCLNQYLYDQLTEVICSYLIGFNIISQFSKNRLICSMISIIINSYLYNKIYLLIFENGIIIIYDMKEDEIIYFNAN